MPLKTCINGATTMPYPLEEDIRSAAEAGFEGVELWVSKVERYLKKRSVEDLKEALGQRGLKVASLCPYGLGAFSEKAEENRERMRKAAEFAGAIGCPVLLVCPDAPPPGMGEAEAFRKAGEEAKRLGEICADYGVSIALEPLGGHPFVPGPREALKIVEEADHPDVKLMMDTFHYYKSAVPLEDIAAISVELLALVHINDCEKRPREELTDGHRLWPGEGVIPLEDMIGAIARNGYEGYLSVEIFREEYWKQDVDEISRRAKASLDALLARLKV